MFIIEKTNGTVKARKVADGSKQRTYDGYDKSDGSSPTVITERIFLIGLVDARERRAQAVLDIVNAFLHAENDERVLMLLRGRLAKMMVIIDQPLYRKYVTYSTRGTSMLYVRLSKALYGMLKAVLLFYKRLRFDFEEMGFMVNPYGPCVASMMVNGDQITVCWHVDYLNISHRDEEVVSAFAIQIAETYGHKTTI